MDYIEISDFSSILIVLIGLSFGKVEDTHEVAEKTEKEVKYDNPIDLKMAGLKVDLKMAEVIKPESKLISEMQYYKESALGRIFAMWRAIR